MQMVRSVHQQTGTEDGGFGIRKRVKNIQTCIAEIGQNIKKSLEDLKRIDVTQNPTIAGMKSSQMSKIIIIL